MNEKWLWHKIEHQQWKCQLAGIKKCAINWGELIKSCILWFFSNILLNSVVFWFIFILILPTILVFFRQYSEQYKIYTFSSAIKVLFLLEFIDILIRMQLPMKNNQNHVLIVLRLKLKKRNLNKSKQKQKMP